MCRYLLPVLILLTFLTTMTIHPTYPNFSLPETFTLPTEYTFTDVSDTDSISLTITDDFIYQYAYISYGNNPGWVEIQLQGSLGTNYITGTATATIPISPSDFGLTSPGQSESNNYLVTYTCDSLGDCHDGWQIRQFNATIEEEQQPPPQSTGTVHYVSNSGSDSNNGTQTYSPWQTISKVNSMTFQPGDQVLFKRGDTWRETLAVPSSGNATDYLTFGAYGTGEKPKILGSDVSSGWSNEGGNIWSSDDTFAGFVYQNYDAAEVFFVETDDSTNWGTYQTYVDLSELTQEYDWTLTASRIYIYSPTDPNTRYKSVEVPMRDFGVDVGNEQYIEIDNLEIAYSREINIRTKEVLDGTGITIKDCVIHHVGTRSGDLSGSPYGYNVHILRSNTLVEGNVIHDGGRRCISVHIYDHDGWSFFHFVYQDNILYNGFHGTGLGQSFDGSRHDNSFSDITFRRNLVYDDPSRDPTTDGFDPSNFVSFRASETGSSISDVHVYSNIFRRLTGTGIQIDNVNGVDIFNNVFYEFNTHQTAGRIYVQIDGSGTTNVALKNNIFYGTYDYAIEGSLKFVRMESAFDENEMDMDYNYFYQEDPRYSMVEVNGGIDQYRTNTPFSDITNDFGWESHGIYGTDPLFESTTDYNLQSGSSAIGAGVDVGITYDYGGNSYDNPPSMGAYEYIGGSTGTIGTTYYVSSSSGDNSNDGLSEDYPWKTVGKVNSMTFQPGDNILFKRGDTWRETLMSPSSGNSTYYLSFGAYGTGDNPQILGSNVSSGWTSEGGNVYSSDSSFSEPIASGTGHADIHFVFASGTVVWGNHVSDVGSLAADYDWTWNSGDSKIYVYYSGGNPDTAFSSVEIPQRRECVKTMYEEYINISNIDAFYAEYIGYDTNTNHYDDHDVHGFILQNSEIGYIGGITDNQYGFGTDTIYSDMLIRNNNIHDCGRRGISLDIYGSGFTATNVTVENNTFYDGFHTTGVDLSIGSGSYTGSYDGVYIRNNLFYEPAYWTHTSNQIFLQNYDYAGGGATSNDINIYNNVFKYPGGTCINTEGMTNVSIYHNDFINGGENAASYTIQLWIDQHNHNLNVTNNIFWSNQTQDLFGWSIYTLTDYNEAHLDYNLYYRVSTSLRVLSYAGSLYYMDDQSSINSNYGWETHGVFADPLFVDATNNDFHLQAGSPAIAAGVSIPGITHDRDGTPYNDPPSIGAFEYTG